MSKKLYALTVRGHQYRWDFPVEADPKFIDEWRRDGIEIHEICTVIPMWVADAGLIRPWCFFQDIFHFRNPFAKG